jgi:hypothetical protein
MLVRGSRARSLPAEALSVGQTRKLTANHDDLPLLIMICMSSARGSGASVGTPAAPLIPDRCCDRRVASLSAGRGRSCIVAHDIEAVQTRAAHGRSDKASRRTQSSRDQSAPSRSMTRGLTSLHDVNGALWPACSVDVAWRWQWPYHVALGHERHSVILNMSGVARMGCRM